MATNTTMLKATYHSPTDTQVVNFSTPDPPVDTTDTDTHAHSAFLSTLQRGLAQMQEDINVLLTQKMAEETGGDGERAVGGEDAGEDEEEEEEE